MTPKSAITTAALCIACLGPAGAATAQDATLINDVARIGGDPAVVTVVGQSRTGQPLTALTASDPRSRDRRRHVVLVGGLDGDVHSARLVVDAVRWFKTRAPRTLRSRWALSALPMAAPDGQPGEKPAFPPKDGFFDDPANPESRFVWRWATQQAPDLIVEMHRGERTAVHTPTNGSLAGAMAAGASGIGAAAAVVAVAREGDGPRLLQQVLEQHHTAVESELRVRLQKRGARSPETVARTLAGRYPQSHTVSYIPSVAWVEALRLADGTGDRTLHDRVLAQVRPWLSGQRVLLTDKMGLPALGGAMVYAELALRGDAAAHRLAISAADMLTLTPQGLVARGQGWTDDMFMSAVVLARTGRLPNRERDLTGLADLLLAYAARLQRPDGVFVHFTEGRIAWGRGNGFAALALTEALHALPRQHPARARLVNIYRRQMEAFRRLQDRDGMWRQVVDEPGAYREASVTAMITAAMLRGIRGRWIESSYVQPAERGWRALAARISEDGEIVDVCAGTGAGPTLAYYLARPAITGADDRGGAMALLAAVEMLDVRPARAGR